MYLVLASRRSHVGRERGRGRGAEAVTDGRRAEAADRPTEGYCYSSSFIANTH